MTHTQEWAQFRPVGPKTSCAQVWAANSSFFKIWFCQSLDIIVSYHHVLYQKKLMIQSWENLVTYIRKNGRTDGQTDRRTDRQTYNSFMISWTCKRIGKKVNRLKLMLGAKTS